MGRRLLAGWIVVVLVAGAVVAVRDRSDAEVAYFLPDVLPVGLTLQQAEVAQPGATLAGPLAYRVMVLHRPGDRVFTDFVAAPADPEARGGRIIVHAGRREPFLDGTAILDGVDDGPVRVWWTTSRRSGTLSSTTVGPEELLALARRFAGTGFTAPAGWKGLAGYDGSSAVEGVRYANADGTIDVQVFVHLDRDLLPPRVPEQTTPYVQRRIGRAVVTVLGRGVTAADLRAVVASVRPVDGTTWQAATAAAHLDGRPVRWIELAAGRASTNAGWSLAIEDRGGERCLALLVTERDLVPDGQCGVANWRNDPVLAVPTDRSGPVEVTANGRSLRALGEARFEGQRILAVELPADLVGQVIDPVAVVSRR
ncbi:MAG: hypothetical protein JWN67_2742 [Actinomycetia bacterium]|nr:hypothetical protein [Actinomycetes bacterium]